MIGRGDKGTKKTISLQKHLLIMISFTCDYSEGAHPKILERLAETNFEQLPGYGMDPYCESAKAKIRAACGTPEASSTESWTASRTSASSKAFIFFKVHGGILSCA